MVHYLKTHLVAEDPLEVNNNNTNTLYLHYS